MARLYRSPHRPDGPQARRREGQMTEPPSPARTEPASTPPPRPALPRLRGMADIETSTASAFVLAPPTARSAPEGGGDGIAALVVVLGPVDSLV